MRQDSSITFTDQSSHTHAGLVNYPENLVFADSAKCPVEVRLYDTLPQPGDSEELIILSVKDNTSNQGYSETRVRNKAGWAYFDIARYIQMILGDPDGTFDYSDNSALVPQKEILIILQAFGETFFTATFNAVHGNNKISDRWWSKPRKLRWWAAYPFTFDFVNTAQVTKITNTSTTINFPTVQTSLGFTRIRVRPETLGHGTMTISKSKNGIAFGIAGSTDTGHVEGTKLFSEADNSVTLVSDGCPANPNACYLRWLDRHGELKYWLFSRHSENDIVKATEDRRAGLDPDRFVDGVARDGRMRDAIMTKELTVYTGMLQEWEYEIAESIVNAPFVDMLDIEAYIEESVVLWHRLTVKQGSFSKQLRNRHASDQDLQFAVTLQYDGERSVGV